MLPTIARRCKDKNSAQKNRRIPPKPLRQKKTPCDYKPTKKKRSKYHTTLKFGGMWPGRCNSPPKTQIFYWRAFPFVDFFLHPPKETRVNRSATSRFSQYLLQCDWLHLGHSHNRRGKPSSLCSKSPQILKSKKLAAQFKNRKELTFHTQFAQNTIYAHTPLHRTVLPNRYLCTQKFLDKETFFSEQFLNRGAGTQKLRNTKDFTHFSHSKTLPPNKFYTLKLWDTHKHSCTEVFTQCFTHRSLYTTKFSYARFTPRVRHTQKYLHTEAVEQIFLFPRNFADKAQRLGP